MSCHNSIFHICERLLFLKQAASLTLNSRKMGATIRVYPLVKVNFLWISTMLFQQIFIHTYIIAHILHFLSYTLSLVF